MSKLADATIAAKVALWLEAGGCTVTVRYEADGTGWGIYYTLKLDVKPQPPIKVHEGRVIFPRGSQEAVIQAFIMGGGNE